MSKRLDENIGTVDYDGLIVSNEPVADVVSVKLAANQGTLQRGTVVAGTAGGELTAASKALTATDAVYVLTDETNTGTGSAVATTAYRTGHFARNKMITSSYALVAADEEILRKSGILLSDALNY